MLFPLHLGLALAAPSWPVAKSTALASRFWPQRLRSLQAQHDLAKVRERCPDCVIDGWTCQTDFCRPEHGLVFQYLFNWEYWFAQCFEEIPRDDKSIQLDRDLYCMYPPYEEHITCRNMHEFKFHGVEFFENCTGPSADTVVQEQCNWACKNGRPIIRCVYAFDPEEVHGFDSDNVDYCFVEGVCDANRPGVEHRIVVCNGTALENTVAASAADAETEELLAQSLAELARAREAQRDLDSELQASTDKNAALTFRLEALEKQVNTAAVERKQAAGELARTRQDAKAMQSTYLVLTASLGAFLLLAMACVSYLRKRGPKVVLVTGASAGGGGAAESRADTSATVVMGRSVPVAGGPSDLKATPAEGVAEKWG